MIIFIKWQNTTILDIKTYNNRLFSRENKIGTCGF